LNNEINQLNDKHKKEKNTMRDEHEFNINEKHKEIEEILMKNDKLKKESNKQIEEKEIFLLKKYNKDLEDTYPDYKKDKKGKIKRKKVIDDSWVDAAHGNRKAIFNYLKKEHGEGSEIEFGCWDTKEDVEAMWGEGYEKNIC
jgi:hypothetical protein